jgi:hypothetical protein
LARQGAAGVARQGRARRGRAGQGAAGAARLGVARRGTAWRGAAWQAKENDMGRQKENDMGDEKNDKRWSKATVQRLTAHLSELRKRVGKLTPAVIVADAAKKTSPLHDSFEWDDSAAAVKWRLHQARELVCKLKLNVGTDDEPKMVRTMMVVEDEDGDESYIPMAEIKSKGLSGQILERAKSDMRAWIERYGVYEELFSATKDARRMMAKLDSVKASD